jgi:hypothetical protein
MQERKYLDIPVGTRTRTAARVPIDGEYEFVEHVVSSDCSPSDAERTMYFVRGSLMPPCKRCGKRGIWELKEAKFETTSDIWQKQNEYVLKNVRGDRPDVPYPSGSQR